MIAKLLMYPTEIPEGDDGATAFRDLGPLRVGPRKVCDRPALRFRKTDGRGPFASTHISSKPKDNAQASRCQVWFCGFLSGMVTAR